MSAPDITGLFPSQADLLAQGFLESDRSWLICAPTGAGKTRMAEWALQAAIDKGYRGAYLAPLKAIVDERLGDWRDDYPEWNLGLFTGETTRQGKRPAPRSESVLLFTPEKLAGYLQNWKKHLNWLAELDVVVIDEIHLLGDPHRGAALETMLGRLRRINPFIRYVGLSGTLSNHQEIGRWLNAQVFVTDWRPVEVTQKIRRFKRVSDKKDILLEEVEQTIEEGGQVLVFVNSRRRSEALVKLLQEQGFNADFNHAGRAREHRSASQTAMRQGRLQVMVSTSTLEMGVNFPARKVIIFDAYGFDGERFTPLSIRRYRQSIGRAGRAGYDRTGEAVLLLPNWHRDAERYLTADPEPVSSSLFSTQNLLREILSEVSSRLSISEEHLETNFADCTLWRLQDGQKSLHLHVRHLITAGLLKENEKNDTLYLNPTALGRIAAQMSLSPQTVTLLADFFHAYPEPSEFDVLLVACLCRETTPKLGFNFEEIDYLGDTILEVPSALLDAQSIWFLQAGRGINEKTLLSALKCATLIYQHTRGSSVETLAESYDLYPADIHLLKTHLGWVLDSANRIFSVLSRPKAQEATEEDPPPSPPHKGLAADIKLMVEYGIPGEALVLTLIPGIGPKRAQTLVANGVMTPEDLSHADPDTLGKLLRMRQPTIEKLLQSVGEIDMPPARASQPSGVDNPRPEKHRPKTSWPMDVDPYRLRRALELEVVHASAESLRVTGGSEPHQIGVEEDPFRVRRYTCDCLDFAKGTSNCKHILRARLEHNDQQLTELIRRWQELKPKQLRYSLTELWIRSGRTYDAFQGREVDYQGKRFLAHTKKRRIAR